MITNKTIFVCLGCASRYTLPYIYQPTTDTHSVKCPVCSRKVIINSSNDTPNPELFNGVMCDEQFTLKHLEAKERLKIVLAKILNDRK